MENIFTDIHEGQRCFIIGGGASILRLQKRGFNFQKLEDDITIGCNKAYKLFTPKYLIFRDRSYWLYYKEEVRKTSCVKFCPKEYLEMYKIDDPTVCGLTREEVIQHRDVTSGTVETLWPNAGASALLLAHMMKCNPIYLLGIDLRLDHGRSHFHNDYNSIGKSFRSNIKVFEYVVPKLAEQGVSVFSCSEVSILNKDTTPYIDIFNVI